MTGSFPSFRNASERHRWETQERAAAGAWLASAQALAYAVLPQGNAPHLKQISYLVGNGAAAGTAFLAQVRGVSAILGALAEDVDGGLFASIADHASALTYIELVDHADQFLRANQIGVAGVVAGVAFEDCIRRLRAKHGINPPGISLESLIVELERRDVLMLVDGRYARAAAALRTSATHARWEEFNDRNVRDCVQFTRELIEKLL